MSGGVTIFRVYDLSGEYGVAFMSRSEAEAHRRARMEAELENEIFVEETSLYE